MNASNLGLGFVTCYSIWNINPDLTDQKLLRTQRISPNLMFQMVDNLMLVLHNKYNAHELEKLDLRVYNTVRTLIAAPEEPRTLSSL